VIYVLILVLSKLFACLLNFVPPFLTSLLVPFLILSYLFTSFLVYFVAYLSTPSRINPFRFQAGGFWNLEATKPGFTFLGLFYVLVYIFCYGCMFA